MEYRTSQEELRMCSICKQGFPKTPEYFNRDKSASGGFEHRCRECNKIRNRANYKPHTKKKEDTLIRVSMPKICPNCKKEYPRMNASEYFYKDQTHPDGLDTWCKECHRKRNNKGRPEYNPNICTKCKRELPKTTEYYHRTKHEKTGLQRICKECTKLNGAKYYFDHKEEINTKYGEWVRSSEGKSKTLVYTKRRQARKKELVNDFTVEQWKYCLEYWDGRCAYCWNTPNENQVLAQDHYVPMAKNGGYTVTNVVPACHGPNGCNLYKHAADPEQWIMSNFSNGAEIIGEIQKYFALVGSRQLGQTG